MCLPSDTIAPSLCSDRKLMEALMCAVQPRLNHRRPCHQHVCINTKGSIGYIRSPIWPHVILFDALFAIVFLLPRTRGNHIYTMHPVQLWHLQALLTAYGSWPETDVLTGHLGLWSTHDGCSVTVVDTCCTHVVESWPGIYHKITNCRHVYPRSLDYGG